MSTSTPRGPLSAAASSAATFPILMRLPDLRRSKRDREVPAEVALPAAAAALAAEPTAEPAVDLPTCSGAESACETLAVTSLVAENAEAAPQPEQLVETIAAPAIEECALPEPPPPATEPTVEPIVELDIEPTEQLQTLPPVEPTVFDAPAPEPEAPAEAVVSESPIEPQQNVDDVVASSDAATPDPITKASPADVPEPISPAAARRQRALERQRRQMEQVEPKRTWWRSHLPAIAAGFLVALSLTIYLGLKNRSKQVVATPDPEVPTLDIADGNAADTTVPTESVEPAKLPDSQAAAAVDKPSGKSPLLLSAKPSISRGGNRVTSAPAEAEAEPAPSEVIPSPTSSSSASHIKNPYVEATGLNTPINSPASDDSAAAQPSIEYPRTEPAVYRPGGRVPKTARVPNYPRTSTPYLR